MSEQRRRAIIIKVVAEVGRPELGFDIGRRRNFVASQGGIGSNEGAGRGLGTRKPPQGPDFPVFTDKTDEQVLMDVATATMAATGASSTFLDDV